MLTCLKSTYGFSKIMCRCVLNLGFGNYFKTPDTFINAVSVLKISVIFTWCFDFNAMHFTGTCFILSFLVLYFNSVGLWGGCGIGGGRVGDWRVRGLGVGVGVAIGVMGVVGGGSALKTITATVWVIGPPWPSPWFGGPGLRSTYQTLTVYNCNLST